MNAPRVGVVALQGGFDAHVGLVSRLGAHATAVRTPADLSGRFDGLVLPGGESGTQWRLFEADGWTPAIREFAAAGGAILGTCAGAILLSRHVEPFQPSLDLLAARISRNAYGRQRESFVGDVTLAAGGEIPGVFIRAPRFLDVGPDVEVLARRDGEPVWVRDGRVFAATFHPELAGVRAVHERFLEACGEGWMRAAGVTTVKSSTVDALA